jgi:hypothetical protein
MADKQQKTQEKKGESDGFGDDRNTKWCQEVFTRRDKRLASRYRLYTDDGSSDIIRDKNVVVDVNRDAEGTDQAPVRGDSRLAPRYRIYTDNYTGEAFTA